MSKPKNIFLVRHGLSTGNVDRNAYKHKPDWQIELDSKGRIQAEETGKKLKEFTKFSPVAFYVSPYTRTKQTLDEILKSFGEGNIYKVKEDPRLREIEYGTGKWKATGDSYAQLEKEKIESGPFFYRMPNGESPSDVYNRVTTFLDSLHRHFKMGDFPENVVIVTHGMTMRVFLMRWFHWTVDYFHKVRSIENCGIYHMELQETGKYLLKTELKLRE